jgi:hypothetical protein
MTGQFHVLSQWLNSHANAKALATATTSKPFDERPALTQGKYVPLLERIIVPSEALTGTFSFPEYRYVRYVVSKQSTSLLLFYTFIRFQPRDPPQA